MNTRTFAAFGIAAALLAGTTLATASSDTGAARRAASSAHKAEKAISGHRADKAVQAAENAVALMPQNARYRALLGEAYLASGRFVSAADALNDALALDPANGEAALHLALAQIANGQWSTARETLNAHESTIGAADRGLGLALAGDPESAVTILTAAARMPDATAKTRQNLALSLALAGRWQESKAVAAVDVGPADVDQRIMQWAAFAKPTSASDQVASLLGVTPIEDAGQPQRLALQTTRPTMAAVAQTVSPVDAYMPGESGSSPATVASPVPNAPLGETAQGAMPPSPSVASSTAVPTFGPRAEIVQPLPRSYASTRAMTSRPRDVAGTAVAPSGFNARVAPTEKRRSGDFYVQLGAYENAGIARASWTRLARQHATLATLSPQGAKVMVRGASFYRLSVGGFARGDAIALCGTLRARGARCFVRGDAGDTAAVWGREQVATR